MVLAENEDAVAKIGWEPMSVDQGFKAGDNVVTVSSCTEVNQALGVASPKVEEILDALASRMVDNKTRFWYTRFFLAKEKTRPQIVICPGVAEAIAREAIPKRK